MASSPSNSSATEALDEPLIALTQRCDGDLQKVLSSFFSFLHRRTDFYFVPHDDDLRDGTAKMGFRQGDAEKLLLASFRQFPLRRVPKQRASSEATTNSEVPIQEKNIKSYQSAERKSSNKEETRIPAIEEIRLTDEGLQIPVGNGGTTKSYTWTQNLEECSVIVPIPDVLRAKDLKVEIKSTSVSVRSKQAAADDGDTTLFLEGKLVDLIVPDESTWTLEGGVLLLTLYKKTKTFWSTIIEGDAKIDTSLVDSRRHITDYDESTQASIRKIMFEQNQAKQGFPTSEQIASAKPISPENLPPGVEFIDGKTLSSLRK